MDTHFFAIDLTAPPVIATAVLMSFYKPVLFALVMSAWAWAVGSLDKDLDQFSLPRRTWNLGQLGVGILAVLVWLLIPLFWIGMLIAVMFMSGALLGYVIYRNGQVPPAQQWEISLQFIRDSIDKQQHKQATKRASVKLFDSKGQVLEIPPPTDPSASAHDAMETVLDAALPRHADRVDITVAAEGTEVMVTIDGVAFPQENLVDGRVGAALIDYLKKCAGLDVAERRRKQTGRISAESESDGRHAIDLAFAGSTRGITLRMMIDVASRNLIKFEDLGFLDSQKQLLRPLLEGTSGTVIVACPPHMGLTTTIYSMVDSHDPYTQSIVTLEEDVAFELEGVNHELVSHHSDATAVRDRLAALLRADPQVVMLSRVSDGKVAQMIAESSRDVRYYVGMRQPDTFAALKVWLKAAGNLQKGSAALSAIISQRLVRTLCSTCRVSYQPDPQALRKMNLPPDKVNQLYKQTGQVIVRDKPQTCTDCHGIGYRGRVGVFEIMVLDDDARHLIQAGKLDQLRAYLRKNKMLWLQEAALHKAVKGTTSISEITRAMAKQESSK